MSAVPTTQLDPNAPLAADTPPSRPVPDGPNIRVFDGVVCLGGEDWWYHNRGHFDMQIMRELSRATPVLYVNSIGMRVPSPAEGRMFLTRVSRKIRSIRRGVVRVRENFSVASPVAMPGRLGSAVTTPIVCHQIRRAAREMGIARPLLWVANPRGAELIDGIDHVACVYQRTDRFEDFLGVDRDRLVGFDRALKGHADTTVFCSASLHENESASCAGSVMIDHGVDYETFRAAADARDEPIDVKAIPRPRIGFVGGIDAHTFDPELFVGLVDRLPGFQFVMVGACSLPDGWCDRRNVHFLGRKPYDGVAGYMAACDVLVMPWNRSGWIRACNPIKLKEYLAVGRPVVSTPYPQLARFERLVRVASGADAFARAVTRAVSDPHDPEPGRSLVARDSWGGQAKAALDAIARLGIHPSNALGVE